MQRTIAPRHDVDSDLASFAVIEMQRLYIINCCMGEWRQCRTTHERHRDKFWAKRAIIALRRSEANFPYSYRAKSMSDGGLSEQTVGRTSSYLMVLANSNQYMRNY